MKIFSLLWTVQEVNIPWGGISHDLRGWVLALVMSLIMALGGLSFKVAFNSIGGLTLAPRSVLSWALNPWIIFALAAGIGARVLYFQALNYMSLSEITLLSAMSMVMTVFLAYLVFGETLTVRETFGAMFVIVGVVLIEA